MTSRHTFGGVVHTYQKYDPRNFPSPTQPPPDLVSSAFEHMLAYGSLRELTEEELARAIRLDPGQFASLGPSLEALREMLLERKRKILATYETSHVRDLAERSYRAAGESLGPPKPLRKAFQHAFEEEQLRELEQIWFLAGGERSAFAAELMPLIERLSDKYQVDELAARYTFTGRVRLSIPQALAVKEELEEIDRLLKQLEEAARTAQIGIIDLDALSQFAEPGAINELNEIAQQVQNYLRELAERQGLERTGRSFQLTPKAYRLFQGKLLEHIFNQLQPARTGRHQGAVVGEGSVELERTKDYEFGDSIANMDLPGSFTNALVRSGPGLPIRLKSEDIRIHRTRNTPRCATVVLLDMSGSMRHGLYIDVKRMGLALDGLIRREYPGDYLRFVEMYTFARLRHVSQLASLMPKHPTIFDPMVHLCADMSKPEITESHIPPHFTNIQRALQVGRQLLSVQDTPNRQIILITDGMPTAHFESSMLYLLYPPDPRTEKATLKEGLLCRREGITINIFLLASWSQSHEDVQFANRLAQTTAGRVFFTAGRDLDRYVVWDYLNRRRSILA